MEVIDGSQAVLDGADRGQVAGGRAIAGAGHDGGAGVSADRYFGSDVLSLADALWRLEGQRIQTRKTPIRARDAYPDPSRSANQEPVPSTRPVDQPGRLHPHNPPP